MEFVLLRNFYIKDCIALPNLLDQSAHSIFLFLISFLINVLLLLLLLKCTKYNVKLVYSQY